MTTVLKVEGLTVYRENYAAVQSVSFSVEAGTDTALVGPNGGGKSTLVQAILGILPRKIGTIQILNQRLTSFFENDNHYLQKKEMSSDPSLTVTRESINATQGCGELNS